jgi:diacylglycerol kinase family enzyme
MMMAPNADTGDGQLDVISCGSLGRIGLLRAFPRIFKGTHLSHPAIEAERVRTIDFDIAHEIDIVIDGDVLRHRPRRLEILPGALDVRV